MDQLSTIVIGAIVSACIGVVFLSALFVISSDSKNASDEDSYPRYSYTPIPRWHLVLAIENEASGSLEIEWSRIEYGPDHVDHGGFFVTPRGASNHTFYYRALGEQFQLSLQAYGANDRPFTGVSDLDFENAQHLTVSALYAISPAENSLGIPTIPSRFHDKMSHWKHESVKRARHSSSLTSSSPSSPPPTLS